MAHERGFQRFAGGDRVDGEGATDVVGLVGRATEPVEGP